MGHALPQDRRSLFRSTFAALAALGTLATGPALAQAGWPSKPVRIVVPFPPGGYADMTARLLAGELTVVLGQSVVVENKPGAGGGIGAEAVAHSPADGYTLVMGTIGTQAVNPSLIARLPDDAARDFAPVAFVADAETVLVTHPGLGLGSAGELVTLARAKPRALSYASAGAGSTSHLAGELFNATVGTDLVHVPYKGNAPAMTDLAAGQVSVSFATLQTALPLIRSGKLKALATLGATRSVALPDVPTLKESGVADLDVRNWAGLLAPAGTPPAVTERLAREVDRILSLPAVRARLDADGLRYVTMGPADFARFIGEEAARWGKVIRAANIQGG